MTNYIIKSFFLYYLFILFGGIFILSSNAYAKNPSSFIIESFEFNSETEVFFQGLSCDYQEKGSKNNKYYLFSGSQTLNWAVVKVNGRLHKLRQENKNNKAKSWNNLNWSDGYYSVDIDIRSEQNGFEKGTMIITDLSNGLKIKKPIEGGCSV